MIGQGLKAGVSTAQARKAAAGRVRWDGPATAFAILLALTALMGGSSRGNVLSQPAVELVAVVAGAWALLHLRRDEVAPFRVPLALAGLLIAGMAAQLVPLPPALWTALPGREPFVGLADAAGFAQPWRPLSLTPGATREALFATLTPLAVLLCFVRVDRARWPLVVDALLLVVAVSAVLGLLQVTGRAPGLYFYAWSNKGQAVGVFANRNHQATLLAAALPLLAGYALREWDDPVRARRRRVIAGLGAFFLVPLILVTGSRAGLVLMLVGAVGSGLLYLAHRRDVGGSRRGRRSPRGRRPWLVPAAVAAAAALLVAAVVFLSRAEAIGRLFSQDIGEEKRVRLFGTVVEIARTYLPWGAGFGSFDPVFRLHEPFSNLNPRYFNHAHNEPVELLIEGGIPALLLVAGWLAWIVRGSWRAWRRAPRAFAGTATIARGASIILVMLLLASLGDYPLRTSLLAGVAMLATLMLAADPRKSAMDDRGPRD